MPPLVHGTSPERAQCFWGPAWWARAVWPGLCGLVPAVSRPQLHVEMSIGGPVPPTPCWVLPGDFSSGAARLGGGWAQSGEDTHVGDGFLPWKEGEALVVSFKSGLLRGRSIKPMMSAMAVCPSPLPPTLSLCSLHPCDLGTKAAPQSPASLMSLLCVCACM